MTTKITPIRVTPKQVADKGCVDVKKALQILGCGKTILYEMLKDKTIPWVRINSKKSIPMEAIEQFIAARIQQN